ncbi:MAG: YtxH domain-containing protein [Elusimicrobia bacterium]|nr:YtxH domain-containing protein [Elusimicrobiota bacterium]
MIQDRDSGVLTGLMLFLTGVMTGAVVALLYAPNSGEDTREQLGGWLQEKGQRSRGIVNRLREKIPGRIHSATETGGGFRERVT